MLDLSKAVLPETIIVSGRNYRVQTSFKYWLGFSRLLASKDATLADASFLFPYEKPPMTKEAFDALIGFYSPPQELPRSSGGGAERAVDYFIDADLIYSAFMQQYGVDLVESAMHWHKFLALFRGLHDTKLNEIISYRLYENTSGESNCYTREIEKLRRAWALPEETDDEALKEFDALLA